MPKLTQDEFQSLIPFCTNKQKTVLETYLKSKSSRSAAKVLNVCHQHITNTVQAVRKKAAERNIALHKGGKVPEGFYIKGTTEMLDPDDKTKLRWIKTDKDKKAQADLFNTFADAICEHVNGIYIPKIPVPKNIIEHLLTIYPQPEPHVGMFSWGKETGDDYDCNIASDLLIKSMNQLVLSSPASKYAMLSSIGDWFHMDNTENKTKSGNQLDVDTRHPKVVEIGVKVFCAMVDLALKKHEIVLIKGVGGNHDHLTDYMLSMILAATYRNDPRVIVDLSPGPFKYHRFGNNLIGINHGHMVKPDQLPLIMLADRPKDCGETKHRLWLTGHIHHLTRKEYTANIVVETFRTIAAKDSWHHASGYRSGRDAKAIVLHKEHGEIQRITVAI